MTESDQIIAFISSELLGDERESFSANDDLLQLGLVDSLGIVQLVEHLESVFAVQIRPGEVTPANFRTVNAILTLIASKQSSS